MKNLIERRIPKATREVDTTTTKSLCIRSRSKNRSQYRSQHQSQHQSPCRYQLFMYTIHSHTIHSHPDQLRNRPPTQRRNQPLFRHLNQPQGQRVYRRLIQPQGRQINQLHAQQNIQLHIRRRLLTSLHLVMMHMETKLLSQLRSQLQCRVASLLPTRPQIRPQYRPTNHRHNQPRIPHPDQHPCRPIGRLEVLFPRLQGVRLRSQHQDQPLIRRLCQPIDQVLDQLSSLHQDQQRRGPPDFPQSALIIDVATGTALPGA
mmetsp:Transcript_24275/g.57160  ORF Transcript_24275/g.57160 Transcript_24275/m.57160 type:complete len:260 (+) Transcript_24275:307-1086(+)